MIWQLIYFIFGVLILAKGADWFTRASAQIAELTGLPRLVLGVTLIGLATNLPEFFISTLAAWQGYGAVALGNPVGSNIFNTGLILGICLVRAGAAVQPAWLRDHGIPMVLACVLLFALALWGDLTRTSGIILLVVCALYVAWSVASARSDPDMARQAEQLVDEAVGRVEDHEAVSRRQRWAIVIVLATISGVIVYASSRLVLASAVAIAEELAIPRYVIALTLVAAGTSLPELATALSAAGKGHHDTSLGIVLGSNIYNVLGVVGLAAMVGDLPVKAANQLFDLPFMLLVIALPLLPCLYRQTPGRWTGYALIGLYVSYTYALFNLYGVFDA